MIYSTGKHGTDNPDLTIVLVEYLYVVQSFIEGGQRVTLLNFEGAPAAHARSVKCYDLIQIVWNATF